MIHRIRTANGDSDLTYGGDTLEDWTSYQQGILQGNTAELDIWSAFGSV